MINVSSPDRPARIGLFLAVQVILVGATAAWASYRIVEQRAERALPPLRDVPLEVGPLYDNPLVVSDEQLEHVLTRLRPKFLGKKTKVNHVDHALREWGAKVEFDDPERISGPEMRRLLTNTRRFAEVYGADALPLLMDTANGGVRVRVQEGPASSSHVDHTMAGLAEVGTSPDFPIFTPAGQRTYGDMVRQALRDFNLNQTEYEWSILTFALMLPPTTEWTATNGQKITFDRLAERLMREDLSQGVCFCNHRLFTLTVLLRIDDRMPILDPAVRAKILSFLTDVTTILVRTQSPEGYWDGDWPHGKPANVKDAKTSGDVMADRILATGHALEWWAIAPEELQPPRDTLVAAGQWLARTIENLSDDEIENYYTYLSHAGRALALWRGKMPGDVVGRVE